MNFKFRFQSLLELRRRERDEAGAAVGQANLAIQRVDQQREELNQQRVSMRKASAESRTGEVSVDRLLSAGRYDMQLEADEQALLQTRRELVQELVRRQHKLTTAEAELKRFEKLKSQDQHRHAAELRKVEQAEADDATGRRIALAIARRDKS
tara:strand:- start:19516 stop:19974 length:459 start_codon:yes stop_codon:yes gene_type:complete